MADEDGNGCYTVERIVEDGEPDGEVVLVVRAVAGFDRKLADDLADAIR